MSAAEQPASRPSSSGSSITVSIPVTISAPVSAPITISVPVTVSSPSLLLVSISVPLSISAPISAPISISAPITVSSPISSSVSSSSTPEPALQPDPEPTLQSAWKPPTLEEFLADIERLRSQPTIQDWSDMSAILSHLARTGQERDPPELIQARAMALETTRFFAECTPIMAWNCHFGDREAYENERFRQALARNPLRGSSPPGSPRISAPLAQRLEQIRDASRRTTAEGTPTQAPTQEEALQEPSLQPVQQPAWLSSSQRPQRTAAKRASTAWAGLSPQKRQRRR